MGALNGRVFIRNDYIVGQGKEVLLDAKSLNIKMNQLDRLFHEFTKLMDLDTHKVDLEMFLRFIKVPHVPFLDLLYQLFDKEKKGDLTFHEYMISNWYFLSSSEDNLATMCFQLFDFAKSSVLEVFELKYMINIIWEFTLKKQHTN